MGPDAMIFVFWMLSFKLTFTLSYFTFIKRLFSSSSLSAISVISSAYLRLLIFLRAILIPACASSSPAFLIWCTLPISPPFWTSFRPSPLGHHTAPGWAPWVISNFSAAIYFTHDSAYICAYTSRICIDAAFSIQPTLLPPLCPWVREGGIFLPLQVPKDWVKTWLCPKQTHGWVPCIRKGWKKILLQSKHVEICSFLVPCFNHEFLRATNVLPLFSPPKTDLSSTTPLIKNRF